MNALRTALHRPVSTEAGDLKFGEHACFVGALLVLVLGFVGVGKAAETLSDVLLGTLATLGVGLQLVILGFLVALHRQRETS